LKNSCVSDAFKKNVLRHRPLPLAVPSAVASLWGEVVMALIQGAGINHGSITSCLFPLNSARRNYSDYM